MGLLPPQLLKRHIFLVGIKGTGMAALAEILLRAGVHLIGSDTDERFYTDAILAQLGITVIEDFAPERITNKIELVIHSSAYSPDDHPQLVAARRKGVPILSYTEALGSISRQTPTIAVAGAHGKTTTTALIGTMAQAAKLPSTVLTGGAVVNFGNRSTWSGGERFFVVETCEYRRHFLNFHPNILLLTSVERDHLDYYPTYSSILQAFVEYGQTISKHGLLIYCADDQGARETARRVALRRPDLAMLSYGFAPDARRLITRYRPLPGKSYFQFDGREWGLALPGKHMAQNAAGAICALQALPQILDNFEAPAIDSLVKGLSCYRGCSRRHERIGEPNGILILDDYAHHPTAILATLDGIRKFYPNRRIIVDFASHTYSRTAALLSEFGEAFKDADIVIIHKIYASARETRDKNVDGKTLADSISRNHSCVRYIHEPLDALCYCLDIVRSGDIFLTMGAGDNWILGRQLYQELSKSIHIKHKAT